jgi:adenosine deaminase
MAAMVDTFGWTLDDLQWVTINAMKSAFWPFDQRLTLINEVIKPGYAALREELGAG